MNNKGDWPPALTLDRARVLKLLTGERFYSSEDAALREAVLNAIDACGRRKAQEGVDPSIELVFDERSSTVTVSDNGDGMDQQAMTSLFATIGATASELLSGDQEKAYNPVGEFGVGVVSYFFACDRFQVHSLAKDSEAVSLEFDSSMLVDEIPAKVIDTRQTSRGTTLILFVKDARIFQLFVKQFGHWMRDVDGLIAQMADGTTISQGGLSIPVRQVDVEGPDSVEKAELGPPTLNELWKTFDGNAHVDVLYRGVFVQHFEVKGLWGIGGSIRVNPRRFKPRLNRESFLVEGFEQEITQFLQSIHPKILHVAVDVFRDVVEDSTGGWNPSKWATLWLAVPRSDQYTEAVSVWDREFTTRQAFRLLRKDTQEDVSLNELQNLGAETIYVAPNDLGRASPLIQQAARVLRAKGVPVIQGLMRDPSYLSNVSVAANSTSDLLLNRLGSSLHGTKVIDDSLARQVLEQETIVRVIYVDSPRTAVVRLGQGSLPIVNVVDQIWINLDTPAGKGIVREVADRNEGYTGLLVACHRHAPNQVADIAHHFRTVQSPPVYLGPVMREHLMDLAS